MAELYPVKDYPGYYISAEGCYSERSRRYLKSRLDKAGYPYVKLQKDGKSDSVFLHTLMAIAIYGDIPEGHVVNHIDGRDKTNFSPENLEIITYGGNADHAYRTGLRIPTGTPVCQLDREGNLLVEYKTAREAASKVDVSEKIITAVCRGVPRKTGGTFWCYKEDFGICVGPVLPDTRVEQLDDDGNVINTYKTYIAAAKAVNLSSSAIEQAVKIGCRSSGYYWRQVVIAEGNMDVQTVKKTKERPIPKEVRSWKSIDGYPDYLISKDGRIFSMHRKKFKKTILAAGYVLVTFSKNNNSIRMLVHRLVAMCYIPKVKGKYLINHIDGNTENNTVDNLEWADHSDNAKHAFRTGLNQKGQRPVSQIDVETGECVQVYRSIIVAQTVMNAPKGSIGDACRSKSNRVIAGYRWMFAE